MQKLQLLFNMLVGEGELYVLLLHHLGHALLTASFPKVSQLFPWVCLGDTGVYVFNYVDK